MIWTQRWGTVSAVDAVSECMVPELALYLCVRALSASPMLPPAQACTIMASWIQHDLEPDLQDEVSRQLCVADWFIHCLIYSFFLVLCCYLISSFFSLIHSACLSFVPWFILSFICYLIFFPFMCYLFIHSFIVLWFIHLFFKPSFICHLIHSFIHLVF